MGILDRIFKSLLGRDTEPSESQKRQETVSTSYPVERQSVPTQPATAELKPESTPVSRVEKTVEKPSEAPVTAVHQPFVVQTTGSPSSSPNVESLQSEYVAPPPTFEQQLSETASTPSPMANEVDIYQPDVTESENFSEPGFELPQELFNDPADIGDFVEPVETSETSTTTANPFDSVDNIFDEMVDDFDEAFDAAFNTTAISSGVIESVGPGEVQHDEAAIQDLFANIAANYARPVKNFVFELKRGTATKEWIEICRPAMRSISRAAESMELKLAAKRMVDFDEALSLAQTSEERVLSGEIRDLILSSYDELTEVLPQTFTIGEEEQQREGIIINSLLKQIPDLGRVTFEKLYGAGLTSLDTLFLAKKEDLAAATGIPLWLCERICNKFQEYREELEGTPRDVAQSGYRNRLIELVSELRRHHEGFERASADEWSNPALANEKRKHRQNRQACVLQINVVLAEMGELDLVNEIQKLSFERRIQRLEEYIQNTAIM